MKMKKMIQRVARRYLLSSDEQMYEVVLFWKNPYDSIKKQRWKVEARATVPKLSVFLDMPDVKRRLLSYGSKGSGYWFEDDRKREDVIVYREPSRTHSLFGTVSGREHLYKIEVNGKPLNKALYSQVIKHIEKY